MADREFSSVGHERHNNPRLQIEDREAFLDFKVGENHYQPPYFRLMERLNLEGGRPAPRIIQPKPMWLQELGECGADPLIDLRDPPAYPSGHLPGICNLPVGIDRERAGEGKVR